MSQLENIISVSVPENNALKITGADQLQHGKIVYIKLQGKKLVKATSLFRIKNSTCMIITIIEEGEEGEILWHGDNHQFNAEIKNGDLTVFKQSPEAVTAIQEQLMEKYEQFLLQELDKPEGSLDPGNSADS